MQQEAYGPFVLVLSVLRVLLKQRQVAARLKAKTNLVQPASILYELGSAGFSTFVEAPLRHSQ